MELIVITRPELFDEETDALNQLFRNGLKRLHLRKPKATRRELEDLIRRIPAAYRGRVVLHDHHDLARQYGLGGIHLNQRNPQPPEGYTGTLSCSCHSLEEVRQRKAGYSYVFLSPVYDSISKSGYRAAFSRDELRAAADLLDEHVIALGGVDENRLAELKSLGFGGVAMLGDVWNRTGADFTAHFRHLMRQAYETVPTVLSIAGSDPSGGAGIQADLKSISALGVFAAAAITAVTVQNTVGVQSVYLLPPEVVRAQIRAVLDDLPVRAVKIGMVYDETIVRAVVAALQDYEGSIVYDPVMVSTSGHRLVSPDTLHCISHELIPRCTLVTPNLHEARTLSGTSINGLADMERAAQRLSQQYGTGFLIKGGHLDSKEMCDILCHGNRFRHYTLSQIDSRNLHGTGCTLSSAIAAALSLGNPLEEAVGWAKEYVNRAIQEAGNLHLGHGQGPLWHFFT